ncbi:MAG: hypothetical protein QXQ37_06920 [Nitrososphaerota archaeon]
MTWNKVKRLAAELYPHFVPIIFELETILSKRPNNCYFNYDGTELLLFFDDIILVVPPKIKIKEEEENNNVTQRAKTQEKV